MPQNQNTYIGKIEPEKITEEEYKRRLEEAGRLDPDHVSEERIADIHKDAIFSRALALLPVVILAVTGLMVWQDPKNAHRILCTGSAILFVIYILQIKRASALAHTGSRLLSKLSILSSFLPLLVSLNAAVIAVIHSDTFQKLAANLVQGLDLLKDFLYAASPEYGQKIYNGILLIFILSANFAVIKSFTRVLRGLKTAGKITGTKGGKI